MVEIFRDQLTFGDYGPNKYLFLHGESWNQPASQDTEKARHRPADNRE